MEPKWSKYKSAVQDDLWSALNNQSIVDGLELPATIKTIMDSWALQTGYPIVTVKRDYTNQSAILTQVKTIIIHPVNFFSNWFLFLQLL